MSAPFSFSSSPPRLKSKHVKIDAIWDIRGGAKFCRSFLRTALMEDRGVVAQCCDKRVPCSLVFEEIICSASQVFDYNIAMSSSKDEWKLSNSAFSEIRLSKFWVQCVCNIDRNTQFIAYISKKIICAPWDNWLSKSKVGSKRRDRLLPQGQLQVCLTP